MIALKFVAWVALIVFFVLPLAVCMITIWPTVLGLVGGVWIWWSGYDNLGVIFALMCFVGQYFWLNAQESWVRRPTPKNASADEEALGWYIDESEESRVER